jgi:hypothetical protein
MRMPLPVPRAVMVPITPVQLCWVLWDTEVTECQAVALSVREDEIDRVLVLDARGPLWIKRSDVCFSESWAKNRLANRRR